MSFVEILKVIVLGIVEGFTEWLPISSTGHLILVDEIIKLNVSDAFREMFTYVIQLGAIMAVVVLYFHRLNPFSNRKTTVQKAATVRLWFKIAVACIPAVVIALPLEHFLFGDQPNGLLVALMLIVYGVLFIIIENRNKNAEFPVQRVGQISFQMALAIGVCQVLAIVPGTSRSGVTILGAMLLGCSRESSAEFSFFMGIPALFGASLIKIMKFLIKGNLFTGTEVFYLILGMLIAFVVSVYSIRFLMSYVREHDFKFFGYYRIVLGIIVLSYFGISALVMGQ